jgi:hypothetical protein
MNLLPEQLHDQQYQLLYKLDHNNILPFVRTYIRKWNVYTIGYLVLSIILLVIPLVHGGLLHQAEKFKLMELFNRFALGIGISFSLVFPHEWIHMLAYRWVGAQQTAFAANLKKLYFMATAHRFVASRFEITLVALAPMVIITLLFLLLLPFVSTPWQFTVYGILFTHTSFCTGDIAIVSYFQSNKTMELVTWDDCDEKISYFEGRAK